MLAIFQASKFITKSDLYSFSISIIFLNFQFLNTRWYGIDYPYDYIYLGNFGLWLMCASIYSYLNKNRCNLVCQLALAYNRHKMCY